jgi:hypothetical protein
MRSLALAARVSVVVLLGGGSTAAFAVCSGFTDVPTGHSQCPNVDWLRNRAITQGCTSATLFCPNAAVSRLSMAAFMNRLGNALSPNVLYEQGALSSLTIVASTTVCSTGDIAAEAFPRSVSVTGVITTLASSLVDLSLRVVYSPDGGFTWIQATQAPPRLAGAGGWINGAVQKAAIPLDAGTAYRFGIQLVPAAGPTQLGEWSCQMKMKFVSRTGSGMPY